MLPSDDCIQIGRRLESFRARPYLCSAGKPTVGYGTRWYPDGRPVTLADDAITEELAATIQRDRMYTLWRQIDNVVSVPVSQGQCDALTLLADNIGFGRFRASTLLRKLNAGDTAGASAEFPKWNKETVDGVKRPNNGLTTRRRLERRIFEKG